MRTGLRLCSFALGLLLASQVLALKPTKDYPINDTTVIGDYVKDIQFALVMAEDETPGYWFAAGNKAIDVLFRWKQRAALAMDPATGVWKTKKEDAEIDVARAVLPHLDSMINVYMDQNCSFKDESFESFILLQNGSENLRSIVKGAMQSLQRSVDLGFLSLDSGQITALQAYLGNSGKAAFLKSKKFKQKSTDSGFADMSLHLYYTAALPKDADEMFISGVIELRNLGFITKYYTKDSPTTPRKLKAKDYSSLEEGKMRTAGPGANYCCCNTAGANYRKCCGPTTTGFCNKCATICCLAGVVWCPLNNCPGGCV